MLFLIWLIVDVYDQAQPWWPYFDQWIFIKFFCFYFSFGPFSFFLGSKLSIYFYITSIHIILGFPRFFFLLFFIFPLPPPPPHSKLFMSLCMSFRICLVSFLYHHKNVYYIFPQQHGGCGGNQWRWDQRIPYGMLYIILCTRNKSQVSLVWEW